MDNDSDVCLPRATLQKIIKDCLPPEMRTAGDAVDTIIDCCTEFVQLVSSASNELSENDKKQTIQPEHVIEALRELGFDEFVSQVQATWDDYKDAAAQGSQKLSSRKTKADQAGLSEQEQIELQKRMFAEARARLGPAPSNGLCSAVHNTGNAQGG